MKWFFFILILFLCTTAYSQIEIYKKDKEEEITSKVKDFSKLITKTYCECDSQKLLSVLNENIKTHIESKLGLSIYLSDFNSEKMIYMMTHYGILTEVENFPIGFNCKGESFHIARLQDYQWWNTFESEELLTVEKRSHY